jgi:hypothetical protein
MSKRPHKDASSSGDEEDTAEPIPPSKRARLDPLAEGSDAELGARLEAAVSVAKRALAAIKTIDAGTRISVPVVRSLLRAPKRSHPPEDTRKTFIELARPGIAMPKPGDALKPGTTFPLMSAAFGPAGNLVAFFDDATTSWSLCTTLQQKNELVEYLEEMSHRVVRIQERQDRHLAIALRVLDLFELKDNGPLYQLSPEINQRLSLFPEMDVLFPSSLEAQECALAYLEAVMHLSKYRAQPIAPSIPRPVVSLPARTAPVRPLRPPIPPPPGQLPRPPRA